MAHRDSWLEAGIPIKAEVFCAAEAEAINNPAAINSHHSFV